MKKGGKSTMSRDMYMSVCICVFMHVCLYMSTLNIHICTYASSRLLRYVTCTQCVIDTLLCIHTHYYVS